MRINNIAYGISAVQFKRNKPSGEKNSSTQKSMIDKKTMTFESPKEYPTNNFYAKEDTNRIMSCAPKDVARIYELAQIMSKNVADNLGEVRSDFKKADMTVLFDSSNSILQILEDKTGEKYRIEHRPARMLLCSNLSSGEYLTPQTEGKRIFFEEVSFKDGELECVCANTKDKDEAYKLYFKDGSLSRFEHSKKIREDEKIVRILNFKNGKPKGYIEFECPIKRDSKNIKWLKFYDFIDGVWQATPPDCRY